MTQDGAVFPELEEFISRLEAEQREESEVFGGRAVTWTQAVDAALKNEGFLARFKPAPRRQSMASSGEQVGPWIALLCPFGHRIGDVQGHHDGGTDPVGSFTLVPSRKLFEKTTKAEFQADSADTSNWIFDHRRHWPCALTSCSWPGRSFRPEHVLRLYVAAVEFGFPRVPLAIRAGRTV